MVLVASLLCWLLLPAVALTSGSPTQVVLASLVGGTVIVLIALGFGVFEYRSLSLGEEVDDAE